MQLCFFEDAKLSRFHPLTLTRPLDDLRVGIHTIREKWERSLNLSESARILRRDLEGVFESGTIDPDVPCLWINARYLPDDRLLERVKELNPGNCLQDSNGVIAALTDGTTSQTWHAEGKPRFNSLLVLKTDAFTPVERLWDLFMINQSEIRSDIRNLDVASVVEAGMAWPKHEVIMKNPDNIFVEEGATIEPGTILIAEEGPIYIGKGATICAGAILRGPVAICSESAVKMGARIYGGTTVGPVCKVGGEVNNVIFHSYSNKAHEGYVGNSLIGQWCNIGADSNTSNLKNTYKTIEITDWSSRKEIDSGKQFLGTIMGDHSKTAINVQLNAGTVCGVSCNLFTTNFPPKFITSFTWVGTNVIQPYRLDKAIETMKAVMARRDLKPSDAYLAMMKSIQQDSKM